MCNVYYKVTQAKDKKETIFLKLKLLLSYPIKTKIGMRTASDQSSLLLQADPLSGFQRRMHHVNEIL